MPTDEVRNIGIIVAVTLIVFIPLLVSRQVDSEDKALTDRVFGYAAARQLMTDNPPWLGYGLGNYSTALQQNLDSRGVSYHPWQVAPLHNALLLALFELGLLPTLIAGGGIWWYFKQYGHHLHLLLLAAAPAVLTDHYLVTHPASLLLLVLVMVVLHYLPLAAGDLSPVPVQGRVR